jgi:hypothetical protein
MENDLWILTPEKTGLTGAKGNQSGFLVNPE